MFLVLFYTLLCVSFISCLQFWEPSLHDGSRAEITSILKHLNQTVVIGGSRGSNGPHEHIYEGNLVLFPSKHHHIIQSHISKNQDVSEDAIISLFEHYVNESIIHNTDIFVCSYPTSFCEAFMPYNRSIFWFASHRFSLGRCQVNKWIRLIQHINMTISIKPNDPLNRPISFLAATSEYDVEYIHYYTGLNAQLIEPTGAFYGANKANYSIEHEEILYGPATMYDLKANDSLTFENLVKIYNFKLSHPNTLYGRYRISELAHHKGYVFLPYSTNSALFYEVYAMGIPIFMPTIDFLLKLKILSDRKQTGKENCLAEFSHLKILSPLKSPMTPNESDPESDNEIDITYWLGYTSYYKWKHIIYFNSWNNLFELLNNTNYMIIHEAMMIENEIRINKTLNSDQNIINQVEKNNGKQRIINTNYTESIEKLWNVDQLQVF